MKRALASLTFALSLMALAPAQVPEGDLAQLLPSGTMVFLSVDNLSKAFTLDVDGACMTLLEHEAVQQAFEGATEMLGGLKDKDFLLALDLEENEIARLLNGRVMFAIPEILLKESEVETAGRGGDVKTKVELRFEIGRGMVMMADFGGTRERFEELLENVAKLVAEDEKVHRAQVVIEEFEGTRLYSLETEDTEGKVDEPTWLALVDDLLLLSDRKETLEDFVDLAAKGAPEQDRLSDDPKYVEARETVGRADALLYFNLSELLPLVNQFIEYQIKQLGRGIEQYLRAEDLIESLRLDAIKSLFAGARVEDDEAGLVFGFTFADTEYGLHTLLTYTDAGVEIPPYFSSDFHSASITAFDLSAAYEKFDKMLLHASPFGHKLLQMKIAGIERGGFKLRDTVLNNFGGLVVEMLGYPEATVAGPDDLPTQAYVIRVKDPQSLAETLDELGEELAEEDPVEFMNERINVIPMPFAVAMGGSDPVLSYAVVENYLVAALGKTKMVENLIAHIKNPGESLLDDPDLMAAFEEMPSENVVSIGYVNVADMLTNLLRSTETAIQIRASRGGDPPKMSELMEVQKLINELPDVSDIKYYVVSKTYKTQNAYVQRMLLRKNLEQ
ncbi:MAG: hypothetical protein V2A76_04785 [Planctomycetota bacterium]